jgi:aryl-alcohol dehydrogenase-like predicted oxidoreductase
MEKRILGKTGLQVSVLGLGAHEISHAPIESAGRLLERALDAGLNVIDTAECYGTSEEFIGRSVSHRRSEYYLFTKCGHASGLDLPDWDPRTIEKSIERSLQRLRTDYIDLIQLHSCSEEILRRGEVIAALQRAREAGKVRAIGYSGDRQAALYAIECGAFDTLQTSVNIADQEAIELLLPPAKALHMGVIAKHPIANVAWLSGRHAADPTQRTYRRRLDALNYDFLKSAPDEAVGTALRFTLSVPGVDVAIVGTANPDRWQQNASLLAAGPLPAQSWQAIRKRWHARTWWRKPLPGSKLGWHAWV